MSGERSIHDIASARNTKQSTAWSRIALLVVLFVGLLWQGTVLQTHTHPYATKATEGAARTFVGQPANDRHSPASPDKCPICREIATAGTYVPASPILLPDPAPADIWYSAESLYDTLDRQQAHHWRSRAPPSLLTF